MNARSLAWLAASVVCTMALAANGQPATVAWLADSHGCKVANPQPQAIESIQWSGECREGYADGMGMVTWFSQGKSSGVSAGNFRQGKLTGRGYVTLPQAIYAGTDPSTAATEMAKSWPAGSRLDGEFSANRLLGEGMLTLPNGHKVVVSEADGRLVRKGAFAPARALTR